MSILVLGGAGYIGSHTVDRLVNTTDEEVVVVDSLVTGHRAAVNPQAKFYQGDLADKDFMRKVLKSTQWFTLLPSPWWPNQWLILWSISTITLPEWLNS